MWARLIGFVLGIWLMAAPSVLAYGGPAAVNDRVVGPFAATIALVAASQITRGLRWLAVPLGLWLLVSPFVLGGYPFVATVNSMLVGLATAGLAFVAGKLTRRFGGGWRSLLP